MNRLDASIEFLSFIAEVSDPGTGAIQAGALARRLGMRTEELEAQWHSSPHSAWADFADDVMALLDLLQERTGSLDEAMRLYRGGRIVPQSKTIESLVVQGMAQQVLRELRRDRNLALLTTDAKRSAG